MINYSKLIPQWCEQIQKAASKYYNLDDIIKLKDIKITLHNATWCPDCQRESIEVLAFLEANKNLNIEFELISYEDKENYKDSKTKGILPIKCLPTIIFTNAKNANEILKIEEQAIPNFKSLLIKLLED